MPQKYFVWNTPEGRAIAKTEWDGKGEPPRYEKYWTPDGWFLVDPRTGKHGKGHFFYGRYEPLTIRATEDIGKENALALKGQMLDESHYTVMLKDRSGIVETPDGQILCMLLKDRLRNDLLDGVRPVVRKAANQSVAGGNRADAAGAGRVRRKRKDGSESNITGVPRLEDLPDEHYRRLKPAKGGTFGYNARDVRGGQVYPCRLTAYSGALKSELNLMGELARDVAYWLCYSIVHDRWHTQFTKASQTPLPFLLRTNEGHTPFTTITCNKSWRTAAHVDSGDLKDGFGVMCCLGDFDGCDLVFPRYKVAVRYREGDVLLADVANQVHGNTPLLNHDGTVPNLGKEPERLTCVFYYEENMHRCLPTVEDELDFVNNRKKGDPIWPDRKEHSQRTRPSAGAKRGASRQPGQRRGARS